MVFSIFTESNFRMLVPKVTPHPLVVTPPPQTQVTCRLLSLSLMVLFSSKSDVMIILASGSLGPHEFSGDLINFSKKDIQDFDYKHGVSSHLFRSLISFHSIFYFSVCKLYFFC